MGIMISLNFSPPMSLLIPLRLLEAGGCVFKKAIVSPCYGADAYRENPPIHMDPFRGVLAMDAGLQVIANSGSTHILPLLIGVFVTSCTRLEDNLQVLNALLAR